MWNHLLIFELHKISAVTCDYDSRSCDECPISEMNNKVLLAEKNTGALVIILI